MILKIKRRDFFTVLVAVVLFLDFPWDRIFVLPSALYRINSTDFKLLITGLSALGFVLAMTYCKNTFVKYRFALNYSLFVVGSILLIMLASVLKYSQQTLMRTVVLGHQFFVITLCISILMSFEKDGIKPILNALNMYSFAWYLLVLIQSITYSYGVRILANVNYEWHGFLNSAFVRISLICIPNVMIIYNFCKIRAKEANVFNWLQFGLGVTCALFVQQTRGWLLVLAGACSVVFIFTSRKKLSTLRNIMLLLIVAVILMQTEYFQTLVYSFSGEGVKSASNLARTYAYSYYWECFLDNPLYASGFAANEKYASIVNGPAGMAYYSDTGIVGLIAQTGIFGMVFYAVYVCRICYIAFKCLHREKNTSCLFLIGLAGYVVLNMISLINTSVPYIFMFPFVLAYAEYVYRN